MALFISGVKFLSSSMCVRLGCDTMDVVNALSVYVCFGGIRQFVVNSTGAGMFSNSFCWFCHAVPKLPLRWGYFFSSG